MNAINQAQLADPVQVLPKENLLQIFSYLSRDDVDASSKVNHNWRDSIQSDFSLFTCIEVKNSDAFYSPGENPDPWWDEEDAKLKAMRMTIGHLSRFANLSNNRLKQVLIGLAAFGGCIPKSTGGWRFSRLSVVFDILSLSSHTLTKLQLDYPQTITTDSSVKAAGEYLRTMLVKLSTFAHLAEVELKVLPSELEVISRSENKILKLSSYSSRQGSYWCQSCQSLHSDSPNSETISFLLPLDSIIRDINAFTGGQVSHLGSSFEEGWVEHPLFLDGETVEIIQDSAKTLEKLEVQIELSLFGVPNFVFKCPQLSFCKLVSSLEPAHWRITLPVEDVQESKLRTLAIILECPGIIVINDPMIKWVGISLEVLVLKTEISEESLARVLPLILLMHRVGLTLKTLEIRGVYEEVFVFNATPLVLPALNKLELTGNAGLINAFLAFHKCSSLTHLNLRDGFYQEHGGERVKIAPVYDLVRANSHSLERLALRESLHSRDESLIKSEPEDMVHESMDFPRLVHLSLSFAFEGDSGPFSRSNLPELNNLQLSPALKLHHNRFCINAPQLPKKMEQTPMLLKKENEVTFNSTVNDMGETDSD